MIPWWRGHRRFPRGLRKCCVDSTIAIPGSALALALVSFASLSPLPSLLAPFASSMCWWRWGWWCAGVGPVSIPVGLSLPPLLSLSISCVSKIVQLCVGLLLVCGLSGTFCPVFLGIASFWGGFPFCPRMCGCWLVTSFADSSAKHSIDFPVCQNLVDAQVDG